MIIPIFADLAHPSERKRARELGVDIGILQPGRWNAITDVPGVLVGHSTRIEGENIRTGVTVVLPHEGNLFREKVPAAVFIGNAFGKAVGFTQVEELGNIETPIALTNTLSVWTVADAVAEYVLNLPGNENVRSVNPVVGETNDGSLNDIRGGNIQAAHALEAIEKAKSGPVPEGCVGAGTGTQCLGFKGGIGTASRMLPAESGGYTIGVMVQTNFGGVLSINGAPVGRELGRYHAPPGLGRQIGERDNLNGSCMIVVATDAPLSFRNLRRLAKRSFLAFGRVGAFSSNGSGDYVITFSTNEKIRIREKGGGLERPAPDLHNDAMSPLFQAVVEATEEAIINSLFMATDMTGNGRTIPALPIEETLKILTKYNSLHWNKFLSPYER